MNDHEESERERERKNERVKERQALGIFYIFVGKMYERENAENNTERERKSERETGSWHSYIFVGKIYPVLRSMTSLTQLIGIDMQSCFLCRVV